MDRFLRHALVAVSLCAALGLPSAFAIDAISAGNDHLRGTDAADRFDLLAGDDVGLGLAGNDDLRGGPGRDLLDGGAGDDVLRGDEGPDQLHGGLGADTLEGGIGEDRLYGGDGNDRLAGGGDSDQLSGGAGDDVLEGGEGADYLHGGPGSDTLRGGEGFDEYFSAFEDGAGGVARIVDRAPDAMRFDPALSSSDVAIRIDGADAIVHYLGSTVRVVGGAGGNVISELRFFEQPAVPFTDFLR